MTQLKTIWSKLQWSLAQRGVADTLRQALTRVASRRDQTIARPEMHPFDQQYGVDTSGLIGGGSLRSGHQHDIFNTAYYGIAPSRFRWAVGQWIADPTHAPIQTYSFVDIGCGKGRAVLMASEFVFQQVVGVELHASLAEVAESNVSVWQAAGRSVCPIRIVCQDATEFAFSEGASLLYLFNPFTAPVLKRLVEGIEEAFSQRPGMLDLIYFNPPPDCLLQEHPGFQRLWTGTIPTSQEDLDVDWVASVEDVCSIYRWVGRNAG
jgi:SAM-dependent methyltransferase